MILVTIMLLLLLLLMVSIPNLRTKHPPWSNGSNHSDVDMPSTILIFIYLMAWGCNFSKNFGTPEKTFLLAISRNELPLIYLYWIKSQINLIPVAIFRSSNIYNPQPSSTFCKQTISHGTLLTFPFHGKLRQVC